MRTLIILRTALLVLLARPGVALASPPSAAQSTIPTHVLMVGRSDAVPDTTTGAFTIVVRDANNNPTEFEPVEFRLFNCSGAWISSDPMQPGVTARCVTRSFQAEADVNGTVRMAIVGGGDPAAPHSAGPCAQVFGGGVLLGFVSVAYLDLDGSNGMNGSDLSVWLADWITGEPIARSDFDGDASLGGADLSLWLAYFAAGRSAQSPAAYCP